MSVLTITNTITIDATAATVWDILTNPEQTKKYMFGCEALSDWRVGSSLLWQGVWEGQEMVFVKGSIVEINPHAWLAYTTFDPNSMLPDIPKNYVTVTYKLIETNSQTQLTVTQGDFTRVDDGERRYHEASNNGEGWNPILVQIRDIAETNRNKPVAEKSGSQP